MKNFNQEVLGKAEEKIKEALGKRLALIEMEESADSIRRQVKNQEAKIYTDVCAETTDAGKAVFGNDGARKAEAEKRAETDKGLQALRYSLNEQTKFIAQSKAELEADLAYISIWKAALYGSAGIALGEVAE